MAVKLSPEDVAKLGPSAKAQLRTVQPTERPPAQRAPATPRAPARRSVPPKGHPRRSGRRRAFVAGAAVGALATNRRAARSAVSSSSIFGLITGAALIGALVYRADTISALLGHMTAYWQRVIGLGKAAK